MSHLLQAEELPVVRLLPVWANPWAHASTTRNQNHRGLEALHDLQSWRGFPLFDALDLSWLPAAALIGVHSWRNLRYIGRYCRHTV